MKHKQQPETKADWQEFRRQMPVVQQWAFLDHARVAPLSGPAHRAIEKWATEIAYHGNTPYEIWNEQFDNLRRTSAEMIGAVPEEIALVANTTAGINLVAEGFPWKPGDNVVTLADEFPTNLYPWMHLADQGVEARLVPTEDGRVDLNRLAEACDGRTRILSISWVSFCSGWRNDLPRLAEIAHGCGALFCLDAIQALGVFPIDVRAVGVDFLAADGHKWILGPEGAGVFYCRREHLDLLRPVGVGWNSMVDPLNFSNLEFTFRDTAARYEGGTQNTSGLIGLGASIKLLCHFGQQALSNRVLEITDLACQRLEEIGAVIASDRSAEHKSGIVVFDLPGRDPQQLAQHCLAEHVVLSCRGGRLRISPHAYNDASDIDRLIEALSGK